MTRLFLCSFFSDTADELSRLMEGSLSGRTVTFIPTASLVEKVTFYVKAGRKALERLGLTVNELELSTASSVEIRSTLESSDCLYLSGGNTFYLLQELKRTGADRIIREQVAAGKLYIGESAGLLVAAPDIGYAALMDSPKAAPGLSDFGALGLVDFSPVPHHTNVPFKKQVEKILARYSDELDLRPISNAQALWVRDGQAERVGSPVPDYRLCPPLR